MGYIAGQPRDQITLFPEAMEEYVTAENPVRFIDAYVENLDVVHLGFQRATLPRVGRSPYHPKDLIRLYIYGYLNRVRTTRTLEKESQRNLELMWLMRRLQPDYKTIGDFRKDNKKALQGVCREFIVLCRQMQLFGGELLAIDGSKFKAVNSSKQSYTQSYCTKHVEQIEEQVKQYLDSLEQADAQEDLVEKECTSEQLQQKIQFLQQNKQYYQGLLEEMQQTGKTQICLTDEDSRMMLHHGRIEPCYNVQTVVDAKHKLIVAHEVTQDTCDKNLLAPMAIAAQEILEVESLAVVADKGYYNREQVQHCEDQNITCYVSVPEETPSQKGLYTQDQFTYDAASDSFQCPAGATLTYRGQSKTQGQIRWIYKTEACEGCPLKAKCTTANQRIVNRTNQDHIKHTLRQRMKQYPEMMHHRRCLSEHPFGSLKQWMNQGFFLTKGLEQVQTEMSLSILAYNLKRVLKIMGVKNMLVTLASLEPLPQTLLQAA